LAVDEHERFAALVNEHQAMVFHTLARLVGRRDRLEDLSQEVFLRLWRGLAHFRGEANLRTYLYRIIVNVAQEEWKRRRREQVDVSLSDPGTRWEDRLTMPGPSVTDLLTEQGLKTEVETALLTLSETERAALVLFHQEECTYQEVARILGLPLNTVRTHLHRGRERLRTAVRNKLREWCES
jgi:RNA polymerase sigma factor (sigma-70 family)